MSPAAVQRRAVEDQIRRENHDRLEAEGLLDANRGSPYSDAFATRDNAKE
jgi:hypothetical protein